MGALAVIGSALINGSMAPLSKATGAQSESKPDTGVRETSTKEFNPITTGDRAGAAILTILMSAVVIALPVWLIWE